MQKENLLEMATDALFIDQVNGQDAIDGKKLDSSGNPIKAQVGVNFSKVVHIGDHPAFNNYVENKVQVEANKQRTLGGGIDDTYWANNSKCNEIKQVLSAVQDELKELLITGNPTSEVLKFADTVPNKGYFKLRNTP